MSKVYDLVIFGATGFTGKIAAKYTAGQYGTSIKWAVAGRSKDKLDAVVKECGIEIPVIIADSDDDAALALMCKQTKVVAACAGPFARYGKKLVAACVAAGTDYVDITGELGFVREMIAVYDDDAKKSGSRIVHLCGHDSVPWDISTLMLFKKLQEKEGKGAELRKVDYFTDIKSAPSGGTLETAYGIMFGPEKNLKPHPSVKALGFDPLLKAPKGKSESSLTARNIGTLKIGAGKLASAHPLVEAKPHRTLFFMAGVNANAVKRSNAINNYGSKVTYCEGQCFGSLFGAVIYLINLIFMGLTLIIPPLRAVFLPKPGEGPSEESMAKGYLTVTGVATSVAGTVATSVMKFKVDPGYKDTARMVVESALTLALDNGKLADKSGGVFTPGCCLGPALLDRLCATGTTFECN